MDLSTVVAQQGKFEVDNIELTNFGETINAFDGKFISTDKNLIITAEKFLYNKKDKILNVFFSTAELKSNNLIIKFNKSNYNENNSKLIAEGNIKINDSENNLLMILM